MPRLHELQGLWRRSLLQFPDGRRDTATRVHWLQGSSLYADLRQPDDQPAFDGKTCHADLSQADCLALAQQQGFAGRLQDDGRGFEWQRIIDFQPRSSHADAGTLCFEGRVLVERGRDIDYLERWHRNDTAPTAPAAACCLRARQTGILALLVRVGNRFMFARDRAVPAPFGASLQACVQLADSVEAAQALVDCEISYGRVRGDDFVVTASTLPYRVGARLTPLAADWEITDSEGELAALL